MHSSNGFQENLDTKFFIEKSHCLDSITEILPELNPRKLPVLLVCDEHTKKAAGNKVRAILEDAGIPQREMLLLPESFRIVTPEYSRVLKIKDEILTLDAFPLAVGSGTINDLVKRAAFEANRAYLCIPTASSIDGYSSFGASLVKDSYKTTLPCPPPIAIIADAEILRNAPYAMTASGYGDLYSKYTAGIDWILADSLGIEPIHRESWKMVQDDLDSWLASPEKLKMSDPEAFSALFRGLTMSGFAMQLYRDSRPASGAEHMISHIWEMEHLSSSGLPVSHGFKVSVGTVMISKLMEAFFSYPAGKLKAADIVRKRESWAERKESIHRYFPGSKIRTMVESVCQGKWIDDAHLEGRLEKIISLMPEMKRRLEERIGSSRKLISNLQKAGCPVSYDEFGLSRDDAIITVIKAQMIRKRYTVLDALYETGLLSGLLEEIC